MKLGDYTQKRIRHNPTINSLPSRTNQSFKDDCDVNLILSRYMKTGLSPFENAGKGSYADVSEVPDLLEAHLQIQNAKKAFDQLPSLIRKKLQNNPLMLEQYLADPANHEEAIELGLLTKKEQKNTSQQAQTTTINDDDTQPVSETKSAPKNKNKKTTEGGD